MKERKRWDLNPRTAAGAVSGFRDRRLQPLSHPSIEPCGSCPREDSNLHTLTATDPKSVVTTNSTTRALWICPKGATRKHRVARRECWIRTSASGHSPHLGSRFVPSLGWPPFRDNWDSRARTCDNPIRRQRGTAPLQGTSCPTVGRSTN